MQMTNKSAIIILRNISLWNLINGNEYNALQMAIKALSATPAEQTHEEWEWCTDCKEYDQEQHCCHRYCKVIRETVDEIKQAERTGCWNNHQVACLLAELFGDTCACNYNGIDEWLPEVCDFQDICPRTVGVACWEQFLKHRKRMVGDDNE